MYCWVRDGSGIEEGRGRVLVVGKARLGCDGLVGGRRGRIGGMGLVQAVVEIEFEKVCGGRFRGVAKRSQMSHLCLVVDGGPLNVGYAARLHSRLTCRLKND
jgi:hypothetical protein